MQGERLLELAQPRAERQVPGAQHREHALLLLGSQHRARERDRVQVQTGASHDPGAAAGLAITCMPYSSESTRASQDASMTFSETPIEPHT